MPNYQESQVDGIKWRRCERIEIQNPSAPDVPRIFFHEQDVISVDGQTMRVGQSMPSSVFVEYNPTATIDIYDPETLEPTGETVTHAQLYALLFSAYMTNAVARDETMANMTPIVPPPTPPITGPV